MAGPGGTGAGRPADWCHDCSCQLSRAASAVFLFDLDGTLIDSVYQHVIAWRAALARLDIDLSVWRIHRRIGMSGGLFVSALLRETGRTLSEADIAMLQQAHGEEYLAQAARSGRCPGAATADRADRARRALGDRDQRVHGARQGMRSACWGCRTTRR